MRTLQNTPVVNIFVVQITKKTDGLEVFFPNIFSISASDCWTKK